MGSRGSSALRGVLLRLAEGRWPTLRTVGLVTVAFLLFGLLDAVQLQVYRSFRGEELSFGGAVARNLPFWVLWIPLAFGVLRFGGRLPVVGEGKGRRIGVHSLVGLGVGALHVALWVVARELLAHGHFRPGDYPTILGKFLAERIGVDLLVYGLLVTVAGRHLWAVAEPVSGADGEADDRGVGAAAGTVTDGPGDDDRLVLRAGGRVYVIFRSGVEWVEADGDYMRLHGEREILVRITLKELDARLGPRFVRVSRSALVNLRHLREVRPVSGDRHEAVLASGVRVPVTASYRERLEAPLGTPL